MLNLPISNAQNDDFDCPNTLAPRLTVGYRGRVLPGDANRLRAEPSLEAESRGFIPGEAEFRVFDGPRCEDGYVWWQVYYPDEGVVDPAWTVEGSAEEYWLEPLYIPNYLYDYEFRGISLTHDGRSYPHGELVQVGAPDTENMVDAIQITFDTWVNDYAFGETDPATLTIIPRDEYTSLSETAANAVDALITIIDEPPLPGMPVEPPFVPVTEREHPYHALLLPLSFQNGSGVRYLTTPVEEGHFADVNERTVRYIFVGATENQLISVSLPLYAYLFPEPDEEALSFATEADYTAYLQSVAGELEASSVMDFSRFIPEIDAMMQSLMVEIQPAAPTLQLLPEDVTYEVAPPIAEMLVGTYREIEPFATFSGEDAPPVLEFEFEGEGITSDWNEILIYPVALTEQLNLRDFSELEAVLAERPSPAPIIMGPRINAGMPLATRAEYIDFQNGSGIRYIAHITQDFTQVSPLYIFTGLTDDGLHYVQVVYRLTSETLNTAEITQQLYRTSFDELSGFYSEYIDGAAEVLDTIDASEFTPDLDAMDDFVRSLRIGE